MERGHGVLEFALTEPRGDLPRLFENRLDVVVVAVVRPSAAVVSLVPAENVDELIDILGGNRKNDRGIWAYYCYHHDIGIILDKAYEIASRHRQCELKNPVTAFQRWLQRSYGKEAV